jgi:hypothetical protein
MLTAFALAFCETADNSVEVTLTPAGAALRADTLTSRAEIVLLNTLSADIRLLISLSNATDTTLTALDAALIWVSKAAEAAALTLISFETTLLRAE